MNLADRLVGLGNSLNEEGSVGAADICYEAAECLVDMEKEKRSAKVSISPVSEYSNMPMDITDALAATLYKVLNKYVPEDDQIEYIDPLMQYEEIVNEQ